MFLLKIINHSSARSTSGLFIQTKQSIQIPKPKRYLQQHIIILPTMRSEIFFSILNIH